MKHREISNDNQIQMFFHCGQCLAERPPDQSPQQWASLEAGWTPLGFQIWCKRHDCNVLHVDFEGQRHPANTTRKARKGETS